MPHVVEPGPETLPLRENRVGVHADADFAVEIRHDGRLLPSRPFFDTNQMAGQADIVENKRLAHVLSPIQADQRKRDNERRANPKLTLRQKGRIKAARERADATSAGPPLPGRPDISTWHESRPLDFAPAGGFRGAPHGDCLRILRNCQRALAKGGRVLVVEAVVPSRGQRGWAELLDLEMRVLTPGGRERTDEEFAKLLREGGFRPTRIVPTASHVSGVEGERL